MVVNCKQPERYTQLKGIEEETTAKPKQTEGSLNQKFVVE
jgi:hypothetical protein